MVFNIISIILFICNIGVEIGNIDLIKFISVEVEN